MTTNHTTELNQYAERSILKLDKAGGYYCRHVSAMTAEGLHSKSAIAAELAHRDIEIDRLRAENAELRSEREAMAKQEPVAWRYTTAQGIFRYRSYVTGFDKEYAILKPVPLFARPASIPEGWQLMNIGWLRQMMYVNLLRCHPDKSHMAIYDEIDRVIADAPKPESLKPITNIAQQTIMPDAEERN